MINKLLGKGAMKLCGVLLMVTMLASTMVIMPATVAYATDTVIYEEDFDDGLYVPYDPSASAAENNVPAGGYVEELPGIGKIIKEASRAGKGPITNWDVTNQTYTKKLNLATNADSFEFLTFVPDEEISQGILSYSFDFKFQTGNLAGNSQRTVVRYNNEVTGTNTANNYVPFLIYQSTLYCAGGAGETWSNVANRPTTTLTVGNTYTLKQTFNLAKKTVATYLNDTIVGTEKAFNDTIKDLGIYLSGQVTEVDNIKIEWLKTLPMDIMSVTAAQGTNTVTLTMRDEVASNGLPSTGFSVTNMMTGEKFEAAAAASVEVITLTVADMNFENGISYSIALPEITGLMGGKSTVRNKEIYIGDGKYLRDIKPVDIFGSEHALKPTGNPTNVNKLALWFDAPGEAVAKENISVTSADETLTCTGLVVSATPDARGLYRAEAQLSGYLFGDTAYTANITGLDRAYNLGFETGEGGFLLSACTFEKVGGTEAEPTYTPVTNVAGLADGDKVRISVNVVKTTREAKSVTCSAALSDDYYLNDFDFKIISLAANETNKTAYMTVTVAETDNAILKVFLRKSLTEINPLSTEIVLN